MPVLLAWLGGVITQLVAGFFTQSVQAVAKRLAVTLAAIALIVGLTTAFFTAIQGLVSGIGLVLPSYISSGIGLFLPSNLTACTAVVLTAYALRYAYDWNVKIIQLKLM